MTGYLYYPGCSMDGTGRAYAASLEAIREPLGLDLQEIDDWNCCGASEYLSIGPLRAYALIARNLALAERQGTGPGRWWRRAARATSTWPRPTTTCAPNAAPGRAASTRRSTPAASTTRRARSRSATCSRSSSTRSGLDEVAAPRRPAAARASKVAPYLGCLVTRPDPDGRWATHEHPRAFDRLLAALGAEVVDYPLRTDCCGGHMTQIGPDTAYAMIRRLVETADRLGADLMVDRLPDVPDERRPLPGRDEPPLRDELPHADPVLHPAHRASPSAASPRRSGSAARSSALARPSPGSGSRSRGRGAEAAGCLGVPLPTTAHATSGPDALPMPRMPDDGEARR